MNKDKLIIPILIGIMFVGLGVLVGYEVNRGAVKATADQKVNEIVQNYTLVPRSKLFVGWTNNALGNVSEITNTSITVEKDGEKLSIPVTEKTKVERKKVDTKGVLVDSPGSVSLSGIKAGENVVVVVSANDKGDLTAERIFILPLLPNVSSPTQ